MKKVDIFNAVSESLAGACQYSEPVQALESALYNLIALRLREDIPEDIDVEIEKIATELLADPSFEEELNNYINNSEQFLCQNCNWWTYQGEVMYEHGYCSECNENEES